MNHNALISTLTISVALAASATTFATENGAPSTAAGIYGFSAGYMPPVTDVGAFSIRSSIYRADKNLDSKGNDKLEKFSQTVKSLSLTYIKMTEHRFQGANYGYGIVIPMLDMEIDGRVPKADIAVVGSDSGPSRYSDYSLYSAMASIWQSGHEYNCKYKSQLVTIKRMTPLRQGSITGPFLPLLT